MRAVRGGGWRRGEGGLFGGWEQGGGLEGGDGSGERRGAEGERRGGGVGGSAEGDEAGEDEGEEESAGEGVGGHEVAVLRVASACCAGVMGGENEPRWAGIRIGSLRRAAGGEERTPSLERSRTLPSRASSIPRTCPLSSFPSSPDRRRAGRRRAVARRSSRSRCCSSSLTRMREASEGCRAGRRGRGGSRG